MSYFIALILSAILGIGSIIATPKQPVKTQKVSTASPTSVCLDESVVENGLDPGTIRVPKILKNIQKPTRGNITRGYEIALCQNAGSCDGPELADYILVATNVRADHVVFPNNFEDNLDISDRQLVKQIDFTDNPIINDRYKNRLFRTFCGDWCSTCNPTDVVCLDEECLTGECTTDIPPVVLPYRGTYHCDFIFYLQDSDDKGNPQLDENAEIAPGKENDKLPELPANKSFFSIYFRKGATIPDSLICPFKQSANSQNMDPQSKLSTQGLSGDIIQYPPSSQDYWKLEKNPNSSDGSFTGRNTQIINFTKLNDVNDPADLSGKYEVYKNLLDPESSDLIYLVKPDTITAGLIGLKSNPPQIIKFPYFLLRNTELKSGKQKSIKLGTFLPSTDWIKKWAQESKPAIYLYPKKETKVTVKLHPAGFLTVSDPPYDEKLGWQVIAHPDGTISLKDTSINKSYPYLYYEAQIDKIPKIESGFVVQKADLDSFLKNKLKESGLNIKETDDYMEYWLPRLLSQKENYFLIYFMNKEQIEIIEPLKIDMTIDTQIRVRTYFKPLAKPIDIIKQTLEIPSRRKGNIIVEWGGILDTP